MIRDTVLRVLLAIVLLVCGGNGQILLASDGISSRQPNPDAFCQASYSMQKGSVVQVAKSEKLGGRLLNETNGLTSTECLKRCCLTQHCTVAAFEQQGRLSCYLFDCGDVDDFRCEMVPYSDYEVAILTVSRQALEQRGKTKRPIMAPLKKSLAQSISQISDPPSLCSTFQFQCHTSGDCIAQYDRCNGAYECKDHSDEADCEEYRQEQYRRAQGQDLRDLQRSPMEIDLEDDLRSHSNDDANQEPQLFERARNRIAPETTPVSTATETAEPAWHHRPAITASQLPSAAAKTLGSSERKVDNQIQSTTPVTSVPLDRISTTISIISSTNPHDIQQIHIEKEHVNFTFPVWMNFSDPSHFVISVVLIMTIGFCVGITLFVVCRCICLRKPKVTKYRIVDPEAEDFLLGGTYG